MATSRRMLSLASDEEQSDICALCGSQSAKMTKPQSWKDEKAQLVAKSHHVSIVHSQLQNHIMCDQVFGVEYHEGSSSQCPPQFEEQTEKSIVLLKVLMLC